MKAVCTTESRDVELREVPSPSNPGPWYINVRIAANAINHGDKAFLKLPANMTSRGRLEDVWGASAAGTVIQVGANVPSSYLGRKVAIYRGLKMGSPALGLWCEIAQVPYDACLLLPESVDPKDYSGSLVNVVTAYAFLEQAAAEGHRGVVVTAGNSATGRAMVVLARRRKMPILVLVRGEKARQEVLSSGVDVENVLRSDHPDFMSDLEQRAQELSATAVFDGVGGALITKILPALARGSSIFFYGFLSGEEKVEFPSAIFIMKDFTMRMFSNFNTVTVKEKLGDMLKDLEGCIDDPLFRTFLGDEFELGEIKAAMEHKGGSKKAILVLSK